MAYRTYAKTIVKYVTGISADASLYQRRLYKKYGGSLSNVSKSIDLDMKHGVTKQEVLAFFDKVRNGPSFADIRNNKGIERLENLEKHFTSASLPSSYLQYLVHH
jgi:hypothetical protein